VGGPLIGFVRKFGVNLRLDGGASSVLLVTQSGQSSGLTHGGCQMLGSNSRRLPNPEHGGKDRRWDYS
jgi:hypothetical protein